MPGAIPASAMSEATSDAVRAAPARFEAVGIPRSDSRWLQRLLANRAVVVGALILLVFVVAALLADVLSTHNPMRLVPADRLKPPGAENYLGTDEFGRDVWSLVLHGSRVSLLVGVTTMLLTSIGGIVVGLAAGYSRRLDPIIMRIMDGLMAFPAILLAIALMAARGPGVWNVIFALSVVYTPRTAMLIRSTVLSIRELDYIQAARALGRLDMAIAVRHILPNCVGPLLVQGSFIFAYAILAEAILGFLGVGVPPYVPSWGNVIASGKNVIREAFWVSLFPGLALTLAGLSLNLLGDGRQRGHGGGRRAVGRARGAGGGAWLGRPRVPERHPGAGRRHADPERRRVWPGGLADRDGGARPRSEGRPDCHPCPRGLRLHVSREPLQERRGRALRRHGRDVPPGARRQADGELRRPRARSGRPGPSRAGPRRRARERARHPARQVHGPRCRRSE